MSLTNREAKQLLIHAQQELGSSNFERLVREMIDNGIPPSTQAAAIANLTITASSGSLPTPNGAVTIADASSPTVAELQEAVVELNAKLSLALAALRTAKLIAS